MYKILILSVLLSFELSAQRNFSSHEALEDVNFLMQQMHQIHPGLYRYNDSVHYQEIADNLIYSFTDSIEYFDLFKKIAPLVSEINDGHTNYTHAKSWLKNHPNKLPFIIKDVEGRYLLQYNGTLDSTFNHGLEIVAINGLTLKEIIREIEPFISADNGNEAVKHFYAVRSLYTLYPKFFALQDSVKVLCKDASSDSLRLFNLKCETPKSLMMNIAIRYPKKIRTNLSYAIIDTSLSLGKLDIPSFVEKGSRFDFLQHKFKRSLKNRFKKIEKDSIQNLVLDLRSNGGGYIPNVKRLMKYVSLEPFKLMDTMAFKRTAYFKIFPGYQLLPPILAPIYFNKKDIQYRFKSNKNKSAFKPRKRQHFKGRLYVFTNAGSYSASVTAIALLKDQERATIIGENPGGANWGNHAGSWYQLKLPNSGINVRIPQYRIVHSHPNQVEKNVFTSVDYPVSYKAEDFEMDRDSYEERIVNLLSDLKTSN